MADKITHPIEKFPLKSWDKIRYRDTDAQGHVNNAVFSTFLETGRAELLYDPEAPLNLPGTLFVIVSATLDFLGEVYWPGTVDIGTAVTRIGTSSITLKQGLFQDARLCARAETVIVQIDNETRRSAPLGSEARKRLQALMREPEP